MYVTDTKMCYFRGTVLEDIANQVGVVGLHNIA